MNKEKWVVEVYAGKEFVGKMTGLDGKVAVFVKGEQAMTAAQELKAGGSLGVWCKLVKLDECENIAASH
ncbi:hypothetical protein [Bacillus halotolerans]|uniref:hypothetical protein n=1 Tax=Bacillus halotolerans TaxID=260554 RepID=UPI00192AFCCA|nr:hypothetical protein [Bacillus halotolerans]MBL4978858.1 hypothetical protein [Bacillus halotolerans]